MMPGEFRVLVRWDTGHEDRLQILNLLSRSGMMQESKNREKATQCFAPSMLYSSGLGRASGSRTGPLLMLLIAPCGHQPSFCDII
jgi:hypothetical protein